MNDKLLPKATLLPCPFCGRKAKIWKTVIRETNFVCYYVGCDSKECRVVPCARLQNSELPIFEEEGLVFNSKVCKVLREQAITAWNKRIRSVPSEEELQDVITSEILRQYMTMAEGGRASILDLVKVVRKMIMEGRK